MSGVQKRKLIDNGCYISLKVKGQDGVEMFFRVKKTTKLRKLMNAYCDKRSMDRNAIVFLFDGHRLKADKTPAEVELKDDDEIDAMLHQTGGGYVI